jgi:diguanylate cyclase (GGDEF)-like protein/PAS domain S-box-containing protein
MERGFSFEQILAETSDAVIVTRAEPIDPPGPVIEYVNAAFTRLTGYTAEEAIGNSPRFLQGPDTSDDARLKIRRALDRQEPVRTSIVNYAKNGRRYWLDISIVPLRDAAGRVTHFAAIERDLSSERETAERLYRLATTDELTGLYNRRHFMELLGDALRRAQRYRHPLSLVMLDIDHFKNVNDAYGHAAGDAVLRDIAAGLRGAIRGTDILGRLGGEEFAVALPDSDLAAARILAERLRETVKESPFPIGAAMVRVTVSIGGTCLRATHDTVDDLLQRADEALYRAKTAGRDRVVWEGEATVT